MCIFISQKHSIKQLTFYPLHTLQHVLPSQLDIAIGGDGQKEDQARGWVTENHSSPSSESDIWTNKDSDVTPLEQRTWTTWTMLGFWISDSLSLQAWEGAASIIAVGLTW